MGDVSDLASFSAAWGSDFLLAQGAGGNTSLKFRDSLRIKASGFRLADAGAHNIFIDVPLRVARRMASEDLVYATSPSVRASIETGLHAILPDRVVAHLHVIPVLAVAVRRDAQELLATMLSGLDWFFVPQVRPGLPLCRALKNAMEKCKTPKVIVLANHGVVFAGRSFPEVDALIRDVCDRVAPASRLRSVKCGRDTNGVDPRKLAHTAARLGLEAARVPGAHRLAFDQRALHIAKSGSLYPDHVVFLGAGATEIAGDWSQSCNAHLFLLKGRGAFLSPRKSDEAHEMAACLAEVVLRIPPDAEINYLEKDLEDELLDWEAEKHRAYIAAMSADRK